MSGNGVGYRNGYTQMGGFLPLWINDEAFIAPDVRLMVGNNSQVGGNAGAVARLYSPINDRIYGAAGYADVDQSNVYNTYTQGTFGLETLGQYWDLRGNVYWVPGTQDNFVSSGVPLCVNGTPSFAGNNITFTGQQAALREQAMGGFDMEFGMPLTQAAPWLRVYGGAYSYHANQVAPAPMGADATPIPNTKQHNPWGFRARMDAWISDDMLLGVNVTTDPVWGTNVNGVVDFRFSGWKPTRWFPQWTTRDRMLAPWQRNWRIAVEQYGTSVNATVDAVNPVTGNPYFITFIDNSKTAPGNGTFEHPFTSFNFPNGIPGASVIFVERGNSTLASPYLGTMKLFDNQLLLGQGGPATPLPLSAAFGNCSVNGNFNLPGLDGSGNYPFVSNPAAGPAITLANNNTVAGFNIVHGGGNGITGNNVDNFTLRNLNITGNAGIGIDLVNATGTTTILRDINQNIPGGDYPNPIANNGGGGIFLSTGAGGIANLQVTNVAENSTTVKQPFGISLNAGTGPLTTTLTNVQTNGNQTGLILNGGDQLLSVTFLNVMSNNNMADGVDVSGSNSVILEAVNAAQPLTASGNGGDNLNINITGGGTLQADILGGVFNNSVGGSGIRYSQQGGSGNLNLTGTQLNGNGLDGLGLFGSGGALMSVDVFNSQLRLNHRDGIHNELTTGSSLALVVNSSVLNNNGRDGFFYDLSGGSLLAGTFVSDTLNSNVRSGFFGLLDNSTATLDLTNTVATNSGKNGFLVDATNGSTFVDTVVNGSFNTSGANGIAVSLHNLSTGMLSLTGTTDSGSVQNGVSFMVDNSTFKLTALSSAFNSNGANGFLGSVLAAGNANLTVDNGSTINGNGQNGVYVSTAGNSNIVAAFNNTAINANVVGNGIRLSLDSSPNSSLSLTGTTTLINNGANGLLVDALNGTVFTPTVNGTTIMGNGQDGVQINVLSGSTVGTAAAPGLISNAQIVDNKANGVETNVNGVGSSSNLVFINDQITNTVGTSPQQIGFRYNVSGGGQLTASLSGGTTLANQALNSINGTVTGTGAAGSSSATILLDGVNASGNGQDNAVLAVANGGSLTFTAQNNSSFSNSLGGSGLVANVNDVNSFANIGVDSGTFNNNARAGLVANVAEAVGPAAGQSGASLNVCLTNDSLSNNTLQGIAITAVGPGATASFGVGTLTPGTASIVDFNGHEGVLAQAINQGTVNFREIGSHFDHNGTAGTFDGAKFGANDGTIRILFYGGSTDFNTGNGLEIGGIGGANTFGSDLTVSLGNGFSASNNGLYGLYMDGTGANSANLIQDPNTAPIVLTGNGSGPEFLNFANSNQVLLQLLGSFDNMPGDGVHLSFANITTAIVSINGRGNGTIDNNGGNGVFVQMIDVDNAAVTVSGYSSISNNGLDGVHIEMTGVTKTMNGAIEVQGIPGGTNMLSNGHDGVNIQLTKTNLVDPFNSLPGVNLIVLTTTDNQPFNACIPLPVTLAPGANGVIPSAALRLDSLNVVNTGATGGTGGIIVDGTNSTIVQNDGFITNNTVQGSLNGGGIGVAFTNTVAPTVPTTSGLIISGNTVLSNAGPGIAFTVNNNVPTTVGTADGLQINNNTVDGNNGDGILVSIINAAGSNTSANGMQISGNTVTNNNGIGIQSFISNAGSTMTADGAQFVGNTIQNSNGDGLSIQWNTVTANGLNISQLQDTINNGNGLLLDLANSAISNVTMNNARFDTNQGNGIHTLLNNSSITGLVSNNLTSINNKLNGFDILATNASSLTGATFNGASISTNNLDGIAFIATDGTASTFGTLANPIVFNASQIIDNGQTSPASDGVRLRLYGGSSGNLQFNGTEIGNHSALITQDTGVDFILGSGAFPGGTLVTSFTNSIVGGNNGDGILGLVNGTGAVGGSSATVSLDSTSVSSNIANGLDFAVNNAGNLAVNITNNSRVGGNGGEGMHVAATDTNTLVTTIVTNSSIIDNGQMVLGNGMSFSLDNNARGTLAVTNSTIGNSAPGGMQQDGVLVDLNQNVIGANTNFIAAFTNSVLSNNAVSALEGQVIGPATGPNTTTGLFVTFNQVTANASGQNGVAFNVSNGGLVSFAAQNQSSISGSGFNGLFVNATDANTLAAILFEDSAVNNNGSLLFPGDGINATATNGAHVNIGAETTGIAAMTFSGNFGDGVDVLAAGVNTRSDIDFHNVIVGAPLGSGLTGNSLNGVTLQSNDGAEVNFRAVDSQLDGNGANGLLIAVNDNLGFDTVGRIRIIGGEANDNGGDGYSLLATNTTGVPTGTATITGQFQADDNGVGISAQRNGGYGIDFVASNLIPPGGGIVGNLLMTGGSNLSGNTLGSINVNMTGATQAIVGLSGTFDNNAGDGIDVTLANITGLGLVSIQGPGEVKNNGGTGINVTLTSVHNGGVFIGGFTDVSGNGTKNGAGGLGQDGIKVTMTDVGHDFGAGAGVGALTIDGHTSTLPANIMNVSDNTGSGVNTLINGGSIIDNGSFNTLLVAQPVRVIDYSPPDQLITVAHPNYPPIPDPLLTTSLQNVQTILGITLTPTVAIQNLNLNNNGGTGVGVNKTGAGIQFTVDTLARLVGVPTINNDVITNTGSLDATNHAHDGLRISLLNGADVTGFDIVNNLIGVDATSVAGGNNGNGIIFTAGGTNVGTNTAATLASLNISNNTIANSTTPPGVNGNGIDLVLNNAPVLATVTIDTDLILNNTGDGFQMLNPNTGATNLTVNFTHDTIDGNGSIVPPSANTTYPPGGMGIDIVLSNVNATTATINVLSDATGVNTISNSASFGLFLEATNLARYTLNVTGTGGPNIFDANTDAGIGVVAGSFVNPNNSLDPTKFSVGHISIDNVLIENTIAGVHPSLPNYPFGGDGIGILAQQYAEIASFVIGDPALRNTMLTSNAGDGIKINAIENSQFRETLSDGVTPVTPVGQPTILLQNVDAIGNTQNGIEIIHRDNGLLSWDDPAVNPGAALFQLNNPFSWQYITDGGSFVHLNDVIANTNGRNGLKVDTSNAQFPMTRIDIIDTALNGNSQFNGNGSALVAGNMNGMLFNSSADSITVVHSQDTSASNNIGDGILVTATNASTFGDVLTSSPLGDPTSPTAQPSTFNGMTISGNGTAATLGNGIEVISNNQTTDPANNSSKAVVAISMTGTATHARNLFDSNAGDGFKFTANRFSTNYANLNEIDMRDTTFRHLGGDGVHFITNDSSTTTLNLTSASIGNPTASSNQTGLSGNGIRVTTNNGSTMTMLVGDQTIVNPDPFNAPDVSIYGNQLAGILVQNTNASRFFGETYDTASRFNGNRGYSALLAQSTLAIHQIDSSNFSDNGREGIAMVANAETQSGLGIIVTSLGSPFNNLYDEYHYLNLTPNTVGALVLTNSTVSNNGSQTPYVGSQSNVNGLEIDVSTFASVTADIRNNIFHGNTLDDVATASFQASTGSGGSLGGFNADGSINGANKINTPSSLNNVPASGLDTIFLEDTALLDMRFLHNIGDQVSISSRGSNNPNMNATGARGSDQSGAKFNSGTGITGPHDVSIFQVNAFHYDVVNTTSSTATNTIFTGTNILPLDGTPTGTVQDFARFPGPFVNPPGIFTNRNLEAGIVNQDGFYTNPQANPTNIINPTAFTQVRVDNITQNQFGLGTDGVINYVGATGQFTLATTNVGANPGDVFRVHLLDTNTFNQFGVAQNVEAAFQTGFTNDVTARGFDVRIPPGQTLANPNLGTFYATNPLAPYFDFPSISFPPN